MANSIAALLQQATQLHRQGRLPEAERLYRSALAGNPKSFDAQYLLGMLLAQQGRAEQALPFASSAVTLNSGSSDALMLLGSIMLTLKRADEALGYFDRAVVAQPGNINARYNRAAALEQMGRLPQALEGFDRVVAAQPADAAAWFGRANVLARLSRLPEAIESYDRVLALDPSNAGALTNRGNALAGLHRHEAAVESFDRALTVRPSHVDALSNRAISLKALGRTADALASAERAIAIEPGLVNALVTRGNILLDVGNWADALTSYDRALTIVPHDTEIVASRGWCLIKQGRTEEALAEAERAAARDPGHASAHYALGNALKEMSRDAEALAAYEKAIALRPDYADAYHQFGIALQGLERHDEAIGKFAKAIELRPGFTEAQWGGSWSWLSRGLFAEGWDLYEHRWASRLRGSAPREYPQPRWNGERLSGVLLVWGEQGVGDMVLYASLISKLAGFADKVIVEVDPRLVALFSRSFPEFEIIPLAPALHAGRIDAHVPMGSVPRYTVKSWDDFPSPARGFLRPDAERVRGLRQRLAADGRRVIGLSWISRVAKTGRYKSARLEDFELLLRSPGYRFVDLQYGDTAEERAAVERELGVRIERLDDIDTMNDLDGLAALIAACDAVVTVSNTTAHVAGAVGAPTWVMLPFGRGRIWYWFPQKPVSPWYPSARIRPQVQGQTWADLIAALAPEIEARATASWTPPK